MDLDTGESLALGPPNGLPLLPVASLRTRNGPRGGPVAFGLVTAFLLTNSRAAWCDTGGERAPVREFVYGGDASFPPYEFLDEHGAPAGFNVDLIRSIARQNGISVRVKLLPWTQVLDGVRDRTIDVAAMYCAGRQASEVDSAIPHEVVHHEMFTRTGARPVHTLADLAGRRVLVENGTYSAEVLSELPNIGSVVALESEPATLQALAAGQGDVAVVSQTVAWPFENKHQLAAGIVTTGTPVLLCEYAFVVRHGRRDLVELLNSGIVTAKANGDYARYYERWVQPTSAMATWAPALALGLGGAWLLVVGFMAWTRTLKRRVAHQTEALRHEFEGRARAQRALAENERKLRQAQKMETIGRLAGGIAHDFNNLLTIILSYATFLRDDLVSAGRPVADADEILAATERAARLTRQLLAFSRETPVEVKRLDLRIVVREMVHMTERLVGEGVVIETMLPDEPVVAEVDRAGVEQALLNLAANARDAMQGKGHLVLAVALRTLPPGNSLHLPPGEFATIAVTDTGSGMDEHTLAHLAESFFTTKEVSKGTGLGLASVFATLEKHGGKVGVQTELGRGSTFELIFPRATSTSNAPVALDAHSGRSSSAGGVVLLVEDDEALRRAAHTALNRYGYTVIEARDGEHAQEVASGTARFDVVVTDVVMPRSSGPELVEALRRSTPNLRVLYVSGYVQKDASLDLTAPHMSFLPSRIRRCNWSMP